MTGGEAVTLDMRGGVCHNEGSDHGATTLYGIQPRRTVVARGDWRGFCACREEGDVSESGWATIRGRKMLHDFPCVPEGCDSSRVEIHFCASGLTPDCEIEDVCPLRPIYKEYMRLRDVVEAVLKNDSVERLATYWRTHATLWSDVPSVFDKADSCAKAWEALEETDEQAG